MDARLTDLASHMRDFGLLMLGNAVHHAAFAEIGRPYAHALSVVHAAHAAEILLKSRIAEEDPCRLFRELPKSDSQVQPSFEDLLERGRTVAYGDLPSLLRTVASQDVGDAKRFLEFGRLRNQIVHLAVPHIELSEETLRFAFEVMEPLVNKWWGAVVLDWVNEYDVGGEADQDIAGVLDDIGIQYRTRSQ